MGRSSKKPVLIEVSTEVSTEVDAGDGLPKFKRFIDVVSDTTVSKVISRIFFVTPTADEIQETVEFYKRPGVQVSVVGVAMPFMRNPPKDPPLVEYCQKIGFSEAFSIDIARLAINFLHGKKYANGNLVSAIAAIKEFLVFLKNGVSNHQVLTLKDIEKDIWYSYLGKMEKDSRTTAKLLFRKVKSIFSAYPITSLGGRLKQLSFNEKKGSAKKPAREHTSEEAKDRDYSDTVMYQFLALFIEGFQRRIGYIKHYQELTEKDMPKDWLRPGVTPKPIPGGKGTTDHQVLLEKWLRDEKEGYQILINHHLIWHKLSSIKVSNKVTDGNFYKKLNGITYINDAKKFRISTARSHGFTYGYGGGSLIKAYFNNPDEKQPNNQINQITWCLGNLLMMLTGINKEVALSIPSRIKVKRKGKEEDRSILTRSDDTFLSNDEESNEVMLFGWKNRTGGKGRKKIEISIPKSSPMYEFLLDYEKYVKVKKDGPFFEINNGFSWWDAGNLFNFNELYPVVDENGEYLKSVETPRFRKVFLSGKLLDHLKGVKDANELAEKLRQDLNQKNFDVTLSHYLLKSRAARSVIDIAICTITSEKLNDALKFKGVVFLEPIITAKKKVFLCDCEDPTKPSHDVAIAEECQHYDLCLGCERSLICKEHLPYICCRILQYEDARKLDPYFWTATFEARWMIAHDALEKYTIKDKIHGLELVEQAWVAARTGKVSLPPIILSNRM